MARTDILFPPGRFVGGSLYKEREKRDSKGVTIVHPAGHAKAGQPKTEFVVVYAIPKNPGEQAWFQTPWGQQVVAVAAAGHPQSYQSPTYAWKIKDGDSTIPNKRGRKPCENEGWPGHWIVVFSSSYAPDIYRQDGGKARPLTEVDAVKPGYWVQIQGNVSPNTGESPGVYMNPNMVMFLAYGEEIRQGPNPDEVNWTAGALPPGASATPLGTSAMPTAMPVAAAAPGLPMMPGAPVMPGMPAAVGAPAMPGMGAPLAVQPHAAFLGGPPGAPAPTMGVAMPVPGAVPLPPMQAAPPAPVKQMTAAANGVPYADYIARGWNDALLVQHGLMLP